MRGDRSSPAAHRLGVGDVLRTIVAVLSGAQPTPTGVTFNRRASVSERAGVRAYLTGELTRLGLTVEARAYNTGTNLVVHLAPTTGADGVATLRGVGPTWGPLHATAAGFAPTRTKISTRGAPGPAERFELTLQRGAAVTGRVVDEAGAAIAGARVVATSAAEPFPVVDVRRDGVTTTQTVVMRASSGTVTVMRSGSTSGRTSTCRNTFVSYTRLRACAHCVKLTGSPLSRPRAFTTAPTTWASSSESPSSASARRRL